MNSLSFLFKKNRFLFFLFFISSVTLSQVFIPFGFFQGRGVQISSIDNLEGPQNVTVGSIATITNSKILACTSTFLSASSSDVGVIPLVNITFSGTWPNCLISMFTPLSSGSSTITVTFKNEYNHQASTSFIFTAFPRPAMAFSFRKLLKNYLGSAMRVRRITDNTEQDIGFDGTGNFDSAAYNSFLNHNLANTNITGGAYVGVSPTLTNFTVPNINSITGGIVAMSGKMNGAWIGSQTDFITSPAGPYVNGSTIYTGFFDGTFTKMAKLTLTISGTTVSFTQTEARYLTGDFTANISGNFSSGTSAAAGSGGYGVTLINFTIPVSTSARLKTWYDQTGNNYNATQTTNANQPTINLTGFNGAPEIEFASAYWLQTTQSQNVMSLNRDLTVFFAGKATSLNQVNYGSYNPSNGTDRVGIHLNWSDNNIYWDSPGMCCGSPRLTYANAANVGLNKVYVFGRADTLQYIKINGTTVASKNDASGTYGSPTTPWYLGQSGVGGQSNSKLAEYMQYTTGLTDAQVNSITNEQKNYFGL